MMKDNTTSTLTRSKLNLTNIYNNLENIYNTKGTEKSIRNLIRCFGIDDELIKLNQYTDGGTQYLGDKYRTTSVKKKYVNLNDPDHFDGTTSKWDANIHF